MRCRVYTSCVKTMMKNWHNFVKEDDVYNEVHLVPFQSSPEVSIFDTWDLFSFLRPFKRSELFRENRTKFRFRIFLLLGVGKGSRHVICSNEKNSTIAFIKKKEKKKIYIYIYIWSSILGFNVNSIDKREGSCWHRMWKVGRKIVNEALWF